MKKSFYAAVVTVLVLSSQNVFAMEGYCTAEAAKAAEAIHEINSGHKATASRTEAVAYAGYHSKKYEVSIEEKQYTVNVFEYESAGTSCEISLVQAY
jgi:hypothetical protein